MCSLSRSRRLVACDVDYCLRLAELGLRSIYVPGAELVHHEAVTRSREDDPAELVTFQKVYGRSRDPYYNPNLSSESSFSVQPECTLDYGDLLGRPLKVLFFSHNLNFEGATKVLLDAAEGLKARGQVAPTILSVLDGPARDRVERPGIPCHILTSLGTDDILHGWRHPADYQRSLDIVRAALEHEAPDVVVANVLNSFFVVAVAAQLRIPSLWLIHESYDREALLRNITPFALPLCERAFARAHRVVFASRETSELYSRYNAAKNFVVTHYGLKTADIEASLAHMGRDGARWSLNLSPHEHMILSVGTICERKHQATLAEALSLLALRRRDFHAYLVGARDGTPYLDRVTDIVDKYGTDDRIHLVPETQDVHRYYSAADVFAFSSLLESFPFVILEAMAYGLPIVTTPCCGVAEQVRFDVNALPFRFGGAEELSERLNFLLDNEEKRREMGRNSRKIFEYLPSYGEMLERYERLLFSAWQVGPDH